MKECGNERKNAKLHDDVEAQARDTYKEPVYNKTNEFRCDWLA